MSTGRRKACAKPGCPNVHREPGLYCEEHKRAPDDSYRPTAAERGYTADWYKAKKRFLRDHPWCECEECKGKAYPADTVDHIVPHRGNMTLFWDRRNWQAMAEICHNRKTAEKDGGFGR